MRSENHKEASINQRMFSEKGRRKETRGKKMGHWNSVSNYGRHDGSGNETQGQAESCTIALVTSPDQ